MGTEIGFLIAIPLIIFILLGIYIDNIFKTSPYIVMMSAIAGLCLTCIDIKYLIIPILEGKKKQ
ncbi:MAG: AtpZ/AtpI family protein [Candidatus Paceibacterota bacterium]|jgi:F0F1-type ATP synthase assembly protein I|nr:AtpZ/AtpI family protein [bacterium]